MENQDDMDYVIVDTAPTGHTLLLLDSSENHHRELKKNQLKLPVMLKHYYLKFKIKI